MLTRTALETAVGSFRTPRHLVCRSAKRMEHGQRFAVTGTSSSTQPDMVLERRSMLLQQLIYPALLLVNVPEARSVETQTLETLSDATLAYTFQYPVATSSGKPLRMLLARSPEKYSSAAPLNADARQRIVAELIDVTNFVSVTVTVGPASGSLKDVSPDMWAPKAVAETVLIDRSTSRLSTGQRFALNDIEEVHLEERDGLQYWEYEHLSQGSPTLKEQKSRETFRHALAVTSWRPAMDGTPYLYTLNIACPQAMWEDLQPVIRQSIESFRLVATTRDYIPPDQNPWLFF